MSSQCKEKSNKPTMAHLVEGRRSQNVGIFLSTIKLSPREIKDVVLKLDEKIIDYDTAVRLLENCPTQDEVKRGYKVANFIAYYYQRIP